VLTRLRISASKSSKPRREAGPAVVNAYLDLKRRGRL
jgi:hypothetical protein